MLQVVFIQQAFKKNAFQYFVRIVCFVEWILTEEINIPSEKVRTLASVKGLLIFYCLGHFKFSLKLFQVLVQKYMTYLNLFILVIINILVFTLIGQQLFSNKFDPYTEQGQLHSFDSFFKSFITIFNILTNDDWYGVYVLGT